MGNFKRDNKFGGRGDNRGFGRRDSGRPTMHKVVCSTCGKDCEVPFKPSGDKPVFCNECFKGKGDTERRRFRGKDSGRSNFGEKRMFTAVCDKCGKKCEVPFKPSGDKPIYCSQCFDKPDKKSSGTNQTNKQFEIINAKLDEILKSLSPAAPVKVKEKKTAVKKTKIVKPKKVSKSKVKKTVTPKKPKPKAKKKK